MTMTSPRVEAIGLAHKHLLTEGQKRAAVFAVIARSLTDGPAPVAYATIVYRYKQVGAPPQPGVWARASMDHLTRRLVEEGWLVIVQEADPLAKRSRVWDLGPTVARVYAARARKAG